jgi:hypothetical protein
LRSSASATRRRRRRALLEGALEALLERNVAITLYTREWPHTKLQLIEPSIVNPLLHRDACGAMLDSRGR